MTAAAPSTLLTFYAEWLPLPKNQFRILAMLADKGTFTGNLSDMCRYFSLNPQDKTRKALRASIDTLVEQNYIVSSLVKRTYTLSAVPKDKEIAVPREWVQILRDHNYTSESVAWEQVLKVYLWIWDNDKDAVVKNDMIADDLNISVSTIGSAKNVLEKEYKAITREYISQKLGENYYHRIGQILTTCAWWDDG